MLLLSGERSQTLMSFDYIIYICFICIYVYLVLFLYIFCISFLPVMFNVGYMFLHYCVLNK